MAVLSELGWTYENGVWHHKETGRVVEIKDGVIEVYQRSGQGFYKGWLTMDEFDRFWSIAHVK